MSSSTFYKWKCSRTTHFKEQLKNVLAVGSLTNYKYVNEVEMVSQAGIDLDFYLLA